MTTNDIVIVFMLISVHNILIMMLTTLVKIGIIIWRDR